MISLEGLQDGGFTRFILADQAGNVVVGQLMPAGIHNGSEILYFKRNQLHVSTLCKSYTEHQYIVYLGLIALPLRHYLVQFFPLLFHGHVRYPDQQFPEWPVFEFLILRSPKLIGIAIRK